MTPRAELLQRIVTVSVGIDSAILEHFCGQLEALPAAPGTEQVNALTSGAAPPEARAALIGLVKKWRNEAPDATPSELAWAIRAGNSTDEFHRARQSLEIVWTGPASKESSFRRTARHARIFGPAASSAARRSWIASPNRGRTGSAAITVSCWRTLGPHGSGR